MTNEPFRVAKVGDKVRAPQIMSGVGMIEKINPSIDFSISVRFDEGLASFTFGGKWRIQADARALWYTNDKGELLEERPKKRVEKVVAEDITSSYNYWLCHLYPCESFACFKVPFPSGTPYKIIVEVEE